MLEGVDLNNYFESANTSAPAMRGEDIVQAVSNNRLLRCRLALAPRWRRWEAYGCSPFKRARELGSNRQTKNPKYDNRTRRLSLAIVIEQIDSYR